MKKGILLLIGMMSLATINATHIEKSTSKIGVNYRYDDAVTFIERGIQFYVFLNGNFDFDTNYNEPRYIDYYGRRTRIDRGVRIERDYNGRVRRVGSVFINYDYRGNVKRIGSVYMKYRFGQLTNIGNMQIEYDRYGYPRFYGSIKYNNSRFFDGGFGFDINFEGDICLFDDQYFYRDEFRNNYRKFKEDDDFYYYKARPNAKIGKRSKLLKRRKPNRNSVRNFDKHENRRRGIEPRKKRELSRRNIQQ